MAQSNITGSTAVRLMPSGRQWLTWACLPILLFLLVPLLIIIPMAFSKSDLLIFPPELISARHFIALVHDERWVDSAIVSVKVAVLATILATFAGAFGAMGLHRSRIPGRTAIVALILLPLMIPVVVLALGDYLFLSKFGWTGSWFAIALAHSVMGTPYVFIAVQASLTGLDPALPRALRSLGGGAAALLMHVYWPVILPGLLGGAVFAFVYSFDEVVVSLFLSGPGAVTLPVQMFTSLQFDLSPKIAAVSTLLFLLSILALALQARSAAGSPGRRV